MSEVCCWRGRHIDEFPAVLAGFVQELLFNTDGSLAVTPVISSVQTELGYGQSFPISTPDAANVTAVTLVRLGSFTHSFDQNQALQPPHIYALCRACKRSNPGKRHFMPTRPLHALHFREWSSFGGENCSRKLAVLHLLVTCSGLVTSFSQFR